MQVKSEMAPGRGRADVQLKLKGREVAWGRKAASNHLNLTFDVPFASAGGQPLIVRTERGTGKSVPFMRCLNQVCPTKARSTTLPLTELMFAQYQPTALDPHPPGRVSTGLTPSPRPC